MQLWIEVSSYSLKIAPVTTLFKAFEQNNISSYRPISVLPCFPEILECVMYNSLSKYLIEDKILY